MFKALANFRWYCAVGLLLLTALLVPSVCAPNGDSLEAGFTNPPVEARLWCYWWWLNGHTDQDTITRDLEQMKAKGYAGALLVDADGSSQLGNRQVSPGPTFASPEWRALYRHALQQAARLDLGISLNIQSGWNLGGPMVTPEQGAKLLTWSRIAVQGPADIRQPLPQPPTRNGFYRDIAVLAYPLRHGPALPRHPIRGLSIKSAAEEAGFSVPVTTPLLDEAPVDAGEEDAHANQVLDVTASMTPDGQFTRHLPEGDWEILRMGYTSSDARTSTSSGAWQGLAIDYLDRTALEQYWREVLDPLLADSRPYLGRTLRFLADDSWELGGLNWTSRFRDEFRQRRGYDPLPYLPIVAGRILDDRAASHRFLNDFRRTVGDLIVSEHYVPYAAIAARYGLGIHPESGGPHGAPIDALETLGVSAFPQTEFWARSTTHRTTDMDRFFVKEGSSAAHIYGRNIVAAEGPTDIGPHWEESLWDNLKPTFDQAVCEGLNRLVWHTFTSSPAAAGLPGQEYFAGTHLNPNSTWWNQAGAFLGYINRTQFLMQQGQPVSDVAYYYGDQVPNFVQTKFFDPAKVLPGYDYDVVDEEVLTHRMTVRNGRLELPGGVSYRLLVLADRNSMSLAALRAVEKLVQAGAAVVGTRPLHATGLGSGGVEADREICAIAERLWGGAKPAIRNTQPGREVLAALGLPPDFQFQSGSFDYVHRHSGETEIYFVRNTRSEPVRSEVTLRVHGKAPELWHPDTGEIEPQAVYTFTADGRTHMPLWLEPNGSVFIVFRHPAAGHMVDVSPGTSPYRVLLAGNQFESGTPGRYTLHTDTGAQLTADIPALPPPQALSVPWTVAFTPGWNAPAQVTFDRLQSWTESADPGIRYYSGTATYTARFSVSADQLAPGRRLYLDLGDVREIAQVRLNARDLGILWKKPFRVDATSAAKPGQNRLEIEVTNFWPNRLIGDAGLSPEKRLTHTNIVKFTAESPLIPSGLLGPVTIASGASVPLR